ncbi:MAG: biopolymer transporter ExbD [Flavobacterium sp.]|nr:MAG: biopolymer transporter ExbD [Flavobacterium sp.]
MAELNQSPGKGGSRKIRSRKLNARVDLTAMVDLAFLLITFFMLTTSLSKPKSMHLTMPADGPSMPVDENRTMTIVIGSQNKVHCFMGKASTDYKEIRLGTNELRRELISRKKDALAYSEANGRPGKGLIVIIKPGDKSNYGNLVDVLDEMAISEIGSYSIVDIDKTEANLFK